MWCASPASAVAFCAWLWVSNLVPTQGQEAGGRSGTDCEGKSRFTKEDDNSLEIQKNDSFEVHGIPAVD